MAKSTPFASRDTYPWPWNARKSRRHQREAISDQRVVREGRGAVPVTCDPSRMFHSQLTSESFPRTTKLTGTGRMPTLLLVLIPAHPPFSSWTVAPSTLSHPIRLSRSTADFPDFQARPRGPARCGRRVNLSGMTISWPLPGFNAPAISMQVG